MKPITLTIRILIIVLASALGGVVASAAPKSLSVTVVGADASDPRWRAVEEAAEFWNQQLTDAGVDVRLRPITRLIQPVPDGALRELSEAILGARLKPEIPEGVRQIPGDIVVALSTADLISFELRQGRKALIGIRRADIPPLSLPNVPRNVVAHVLGLALGLRHNSDPATLMCGRPAPCHPSIFASERAQFFPLTAADRATLRARWQLNAQAGGSPDLIEPVKSAKPQALSAPPNRAATDRLIVPGERIGRLQLDGKINDIVKLFGPGTLSPGGWSFSKLQRWDAVGLWVDFDPATGNVLWIGIEASGSHRWAEYSTLQGIRIGARREDILSAMGRPERILTAGGITSFYYDSRGIRLTLADKGPHAETVGEIRIIWPSVPRGDTLILAGRRISALEMKMPIDRALTALGGGYHRGESAPGFHVYYWPHLGLSLVETGGYVNSVRAARDRPSDGLGIRYATADGLGEGSALAEVKRIFGEPKRTQLGQGDLNSWIYDSRGIAFALDRMEKVRSIDVFPSSGGANAYNDSGVGYAQKGDLERAIADFDKAIELDPKYTAAYLNRGNAYARKGDLERAIADFNKTIELDPKNATAYNNRAMTYFTFGNAAQALPDVDKALDLRPGDPFALDTRGHIFEALGRKDDAVVDFQRALEKAPDLQSSKDALKRLR